MGKGEGEGNVDDWEKKKENEKVDILGKEEGEEKVNWENEKAEEMLMIQEKRSKKMMNGKRRTKRRKSR